MFLIQQNFEEIIPTTKNTHLCETLNKFYAISRFLQNQTKNMMGKQIK